MPGRCPSCNQTYTDESLTFCPNDGTPLVREAPGAYNPPPAGMAGGQPPAPGYPPPPQQGGYYPGQQPGGQAPPPPGWQQQQQQPPPPYGQQQQYAPPPYGAGPARASKMPLIIGLLALVLIGGGIGLYFLLKGDSTEATNTRNSPTVTSSPGTNIKPPTATATPLMTTPTTTTTARNYTEDEKHRLFQAVGITGDTDLIIEVAYKIGIADAKGNQNENFEPFRQQHPDWAARNLAWVREYRDKDKARAYVMANK
ncbi:MAG TPA: hypothetical protein VGC87_12705 [Pyrinomonadaceae bacterium]|jgi:hypothetical protein